MRIKTFVRFDSQIVKIAWAVELRFYIVGCSYQVDPEWMTLK